MLLFSSFNFRLRELADRLGITVRIAHIEGDDLRGNLSAITPAVGEVKPVSANAYLGGWGIAEALGAGADVVVTGRVTDRPCWSSARPPGGTGGSAPTASARRCRSHATSSNADHRATGGNYAFLDEITDCRCTRASRSRRWYDGLPGSPSTPTPGAGVACDGHCPAALRGSPSRHLGPDVVTTSTRSRLQQAEHRWRSRVSPAARHRARSRWR